jgi:3-phosphoshikimate 1-carboxyvinyltransferase
MIEIKAKKIKNQTVVVPGSKSYTHRLLIASALSQGICEIRNMLRSEDTLLTLEALKRMGIRITAAGDHLQVHGMNGTLGPCPDPIYLGNSGTSMRLLTGVAALGKGAYTLTGTERMCERPLQDLLDGLTQIGIHAVSLNNDGCPPVEVRGGGVRGGKVELKCNISSQYLSAMMLIAPCTREGLDITATHSVVSKPYVDMTIDIMTRLGVEVIRDAYTRFQVAGGQPYAAGSYTVEPDCSQAGYFWAAAAVTGASIKVHGITKATRQGDVGFVDVLEKMGCRADHEADGITITGGNLSGVEVDMSNMPDMVPTLGVVAAFAEGTTVIKNVAHLKEKESDRLGSVAAELGRIGIDAKALDSGLVIKGGRPRGSQIETYDDHRIAMSFAVAGLRAPGIFIKNPSCVQKSFPNFWDVFGRLYEK